MATPARTVQLRTVDQVLTAYAQWDTPCFALWNAKQLLFAYDNEDASIEHGEQLLQQWCDILYTSGSAGIYSLCIYKNLNSKDITNTTPYNGSVNFQFHEYKGYGASVGSPAVIDPATKILLDQMQAMQLQIQKLQEEKDDEGDDDDGDDIMGKLTKLLETPLISGLLTNLLPKPAVGQTRNVGVPPMQPVAQPVGTASRIAGTNQEQGDQVIAEALEVLKKSVLDLPAVMLQLSKLATLQPDQFKLYVTMLMNKKL